MADDDPIRKPLRNQPLYPPDFPPEGQRWVTAAIVREKQAFARQRDAAFTSVTGTIELASVRPDKHLFDVWVLRNRHCVLRPFRVFAREARRVPPWEAEEMKRHGRDFLVQLSMEAESEERYDNFGHEVGSLLNDAGDDLRPEIWEIFRRSPQWRYFERQVLRVAQTPPPKPAEPRLLPPEATLVEPEVIFTPEQQEPEPQLWEGQLPAAAADQRQAPVPAPPTEGEVFTHSDDYLNITFRGEQYTLPENGATIVRHLHEAYKRGKPVVHGGALLTVIGSTTEVRSYFKRSPLWKTLVIDGPRRGTYQLNLPPLPPASKPQP